MRLRIDKHSQLAPHLIYGWLPGKKKASVTTPLTYKKVQISHFQLEARGESTQKTTTKTLGAALFSRTLLEENNNATCTPASLLIVQLVYDSEQKT